eukprot:1790949-Pleurochrysis_carterae.AAC.1
MGGAGLTPTSERRGGIRSTRPAGPESFEASELLAPPGAHTHQGPRSLSGVGAEHLQLWRPHPLSPERGVSPGCAEGVQLVYNLVWIMHWELCNS